MGAGVRRGQDVESGGSILVPVDSFLAGADGFLDLVQRIELRFTIGGILLLTV